ncbi:MAG: hypothetical protein JWN40_4286 [Phycisphaerales bacterium]|nr:hypothetical protein [Phycisphaerales bacterium]
MGCGCVRLASRRASSASVPGGIAWPKMPSGLSRIIAPFASLVRLATFRALDAKFAPTLLATDSARPIVPPQSNGPDAYQCP